MQARRENRTVGSTGELLHPRKQRIATYGARHRLDDSGARIGLGNEHQPAQTLSGHDAVRIENHHVAVLATPAPAEIGDVAAFAFDTVPAPAIEDSPESVHCAAHPDPRLDLLDPCVGIHRVGQDEEIEPVGRAGRPQRLIGGA